MKLGEMITNKRKELKLSQTELAQLMGFKNKTSITYIEKNKREIPRRTYQLFADFLGISITELTSLLLSDDEPHIEVEVMNTIVKKATQKENELYPKTIYAIQHNATKRIYIGCASRLDKRYKSHINALRRGKHDVEDMQEDFNKYGEDFSLFELGVIETPKDKFKEFYYMNEYQSYIRGIGYNYNDPYFEKDKIVVPFKSGLPQKLEEVNSND